ncbi:MAG TPA: DMT family transporter [Euryarchaeota archaeon]|nr:DMT family transporter [Euryarchaeota archaeon]
MQQGVTGAKSVSLVLISIILWAVSFPIIKIILAENPPMAVASLRMVIAAAVAILVMVATRGSKRLVTVVKENFVSLALFGILYQAIPNVFQNIGMSMMDVNTAATVSGVLQCSGPVLTIILAIVFLKERPTVKLVAGMIMALAGSVLMVSGGLSDFVSANFWGSLLLLASAFSYSVAGTIGKKKLSTIDSHELVLVSLPFGTMATLVAWPIIEEPVFVFSMKTWLLVGFLALFSGILAVFIWFKVMERVDLSRMTLFVYLIPVVSGAIAIIFLNERIPPSVYAFAMLILLGVIVAQWK